MLYVVFFFFLLKLDGHLLCVKIVRNDRILIYTWFLKIKRRCHKLMRQGKHYLHFTFYRIISIISSVNTLRLKKAKLIPEVLQLWEKRLHLLNKIPEVLFKANGRMFFTFVRGLFWRSSPFSSFVSNRTAHKKPNLFFTISKESIFCKPTVIKTLWY